MKRRVFPALGLVLLVLTACGGDATSEPTSTTQAAAVSTAATGETVGTVATTVPSSGPTGSAEEICADIFSLDEVEMLFGEPAEYDEDTANGYDSSLGRILCSWSTVEDSTDFTDRAFETLVVQVYLGDPIAGPNFYSPDDIYEDVRHLDGIGEDAYVAGSLGLDLGFLDGQVAGFLSYGAFDLGESGFVGAGEDAAIEYLRILHDRVTG